MRRSSRILTKQETVPSYPNSEPLQPFSRSPQLSPMKNIKQFRSKSTPSTEVRVHRKRGLKSRRKSGEAVKSKRFQVNKHVKNILPRITGQHEIISSDCHEIGTDISENEISNYDKSVIPAVPLSNQEESNDSVLTDVANVLKIDRTIKNLSPKKFFINRNGKTTRSGRHFSPYDFASYSFLFGSTSSGATSSRLTDPESPQIEAGSSKETKPTRATGKKKLSIKKRAYDRRKIQRKPFGKNYRKFYKRRNKLGHSLPTSETTCTDNQLDSPPFAKSTTTTIKENTEENDDLFSDDVPAAFLIDFPPTVMFQLEGHSLPPNFFNETFEPVCFSPTSTSGRSTTLDPVEMEALSKIWLVDTDKYEFKSLFKDVQAQIAHFENFSGLEISDGDGHKYDLTETEAVEGRRFYRKRITDSRLIAWHKYNLTASTKYSEKTGPPPGRPVIRVRSNLCHRADAVWRLNQTQPLPTVEDIFNLSREPKEFEESRKYRQRSPFR